MDSAASLGNECVSPTWLEDALEHAYAHGQMKVLAYLEALMEDAVFEAEMAATKKGFALGRGCLFWIMVSILLSVGLTILLNLGLFAIGG